MKLRRFIQAGVMSIAVMHVTLVCASEDNIPEPFRGDTKDSPYEISYKDLDTLLRSTVLATGKSNRVQAKKTKAKVGTKLKVNINKLTALEGNRFFFEAFKKDENKELLGKLRLSLAKVPSEVSLNNFSKKEQLAYWLNLYNVTILDEIVKVYPERKLEDFLDDTLDKKILTVAGIKLSLNDIQYNILKEKYDNDPLIIYGLYQGIIGGPNIRKRAYTGDNVYQALAANADEFVNSNRGTYAGKKDVFRISTLYKRNKEFFPNFNSTIKEHLLTHLSGSMRYKLENSDKIKANISNWRITDLYGTTRSFGGGNANNGAAMLDSVSSPLPTAAEGSDAGIGAANIALASEFFAQHNVSFGRFSPEQMAQLKAINKKRLDTTGVVTVTDLEKQKDDNK